MGLAGLNGLLCEEHFGKGLTQSRTEYTQYTGQSSPCSYLAWWIFFMVLIVWKVSRKLQLYLLSLSIGSLNHDSNDLFDLKISLKVLDLET